MRSTFPKLPKERVLSRQIRVDSQVLETILSSALPGEVRANQVLRRLLGLDYIGRTVTKESVIEDTFESTKSKYGCPNGCRYGCGCTSVWTKDSVHTEESI